MQTRCKCTLAKLACKSCKCMNLFKIKHNFYNKNINNYSNYFKKIAYTQIYLKSNTVSIIKI